MCLDALEELAELARNAAHQKREYENFKVSTADSADTDNWSLELTIAEARVVFAARAERAEAKLRAIGWTPPPKRVTEGQRAAELKEAGHTLPGELPDISFLSAEQGAP